MWRNSIFIRKCMYSDGLYNIKSFKGTILSVDINCYQKLDKSNRCTYANMAMLKTVVITWSYILYSKLQVHVCLENNWTGMLSRNIIPLGRIVQWYQLWLRAAVVQSCDWVQDCLSVACLPLFLEIKNIEILSGLPGGLATKTDIVILI